MMKKMMMIAMIIAVCVVTFGTQEVAAAHKEKISVSTTDICVEALSHVGGAYEWGRADDKAADCSGMVWRTFHNLGITEIDGKDFPACTTSWKSFVENEKTLNFSGEDAECQYICMTEDLEQWKGVRGAIILYNNHISVSMGSFKRSTKQYVEKALKVMYDFEAPEKTDECYNSIEVLTSSSVYMVEAYGVSTGVGDRGIIISNSTWKNKDTIAVFVPVDEIARLLK